MILKFSRFRESLVLGTVLATMLAMVIPSNAHAQSPWYDPSVEEHQAALAECAEGEVGLECTVQAIVKAIENSIAEHTASSPQTPGTSRVQAPGAVQFASSLVTTLIGNPPVSSVDYMGYIAQKLNPVEPAYAQGTGFQALSPLIPIWSAFRNIAYLAFVIIFIFIGFMIMFRARLDPQTVVNVQNSLPKLVITLLLITFSYAIAGFMVDLIYLGIYVVVSVLASQGLISNPGTVRTDLLTDNIFTMTAEAGFFRWALSMSEAINATIEAALNDTFLELVYDAIPFSVTIGKLIISVAILFSLFKLFFQLLLAYIGIILQTILSPILILFNALPGSQSFGNWLRNMLANVLIFPAVALLFLISAILIGQPGERWQVEPLVPGGGQFWSPPFVAMETTAEHIMAIIGLGFMLFAPQMVAVLQKTLKAQPLPVSGVFAPLVAGAGVVSAPIRGIGGAVSTGVRTYFGQKVEAIAGETQRRG
jgi:hypothetical protein